MPLMTTAQLVQCMGAPFAYYPTTSKQYLQLDSLRQNVESQIKQFCRWPIEQGRLPNEYKDGNGNNQLVLNVPYASYVNNVWIDAFGNYGANPNGAFQGNPLPQGTSYALEVSNNGSGTLRMLQINQAWWFSEYNFMRTPGGLAFRNPSWWPSGFGNIQVDYWYGFPSTLGLTGASWTNGILTLTCSSTVYLQPRWLITIWGATPATYNGTYAVNTLPAYPSTGNTVQVTLGMDPGSFVSGNLNCVPLDIQQAVVESVAIALNSSRWGNQLTSESMGGRSVSIASGTDWQSVRQMLSRWRDPASGGVGF